MAYCFGAMPYYFIFQNKKCANQSQRTEKRKPQLLSHKFYIV